MSSASVLSKYTGEPYNDDLILIEISKKKDIESNLEEKGLTFEETISEIYNLRSKYFHRGESKISDKYHSNIVSKYYEEGVKVIRYHHSLVFWFEKIVTNALRNFWEDLIKV